MTTIVWARKFTPGHYESRAQVPDTVKEVRLHYNAGTNKNQWFAKYEVPGEARNKLPKIYQNKLIPKKAP